MLLGANTLSVLRMPRTALLAATLLLWAFWFVLTPSSGNAQSAPAASGAWQSDKSYSIDFLARDGSNGPDRYHMVFDYGATFFGAAVNSMPLLPAEDAVKILMDGYRAAYPGHDPKDVQPGNEFDFAVPLGTIVAKQWRKGAGTIEYQSLRGDDLVMYTSPRSLISYKLIRGEDPSKAEMVINRDAELRSPDLAKAVYGNDDPNFTPDVLQVARARKAIQENQESITVDLTKKHIDDFPDMKASAEAGGKNENGLDIYWFRSDQVAQPLFRVDDAVGQATDPAGLPSMMRVYYYKDGVIRTYQRAEDTVLLAGRQAPNDQWAKVYAQYGKLDPAPTRWENGQPEDSPEARELGNLGIVVLRYDPKDPPKGNFFTQFLDWVMGLMKRKQA